jgi:streptogramin lyase
VVQGNFIGTDVTGSAALGNTGDGVLVVASSNTIGGTASGAGNVISGNAQGVVISAVGLTGNLFGGSGFIGATGNLVQGNLIGTNSSGTAALPGTVSWWPLDETTGSVAHDSVGSNNATLTGTTSVSGEVGNGRRFILGDLFAADGSGTLNLTGNQVSIEAWIKLENNPTTSQAFTAFVGKTTFPTNQAYMITFESGSNVGLPQNQWQFEYILTNSVGVRVHNQSTGIVVPVDSLYHHFAMTYDGANVRLYIDGVLKGTFAFSGNLESIPSEPFRIFGRAPFSIDEPTVYNRALSSSEIASIYAAGSRGKNGILGNKGNGVLIQSGAAGNTIGGITAGAGNIISGNTGDGVTIDGTGPGIAEFPIPTGGSSPSGITAGPDGNLWFAELFGQKIGRITTAGAVTEFPTPTTPSEPFAITAGPDSNLWFTEQQSHRIGQITPAGVITEFPVPNAGVGDLHEITAGPDGNLWFTERFSNRIGRITPAGVVTEFTVPSAGSQPFGIAAGPDGNLWFTELTGNRIGRITTSGVITEFAVPTAGSEPVGITAGPDGSLWFAEEFGNQIGRITTAGVVTEFPLPSAGFNAPYMITAGPGGSLWFTELFGNKIGMITTTGAISEYVVPTSSSNPLGIAAGPDGNLWFTEEGATQIGRLTPRTAANTVEGNTIGLAAGGNVALSNGGSGVRINNSLNNTIGGTAAAARNIISGNSQNGVLITGAGSSANVVEGNYIGTDLTGTVALSNVQGVAINNGAAFNTIGGATAGAGNIISGNSQDGVLIVDSTTTGNVVAGNFIGTDVTGTLPLANLYYGTEVVGASNNTIGGTTAGARNVISGNKLNGVEIYGSTTSGNLVEGNYVGTDVTGMQALGNGQNGVLISGGASSNTIGGSASGARNIISGNEVNLVGGGFAAQLRVSGSGTNNNWIAGNFIGTNAAGSAALGTNSQGVLIDFGAADNTVGGVTATPGTGPGNVVSGNGFSGIGAFFGANNNWIAGNIVGLNATGTAVIANGSDGVFFGFGATGNTLGGSMAGARNIISGNLTVGTYGKQAGVLIFDGAANSVVQGNYIGTDITGTVALGNGANGVEILGAINNIIGGTTAGAGNLISGNQQNGVYIVNAVNNFGFTGPSTGNVVQGNYIGTDVSGTVVLGNTGDGVLISGVSQNNTIGGTAAGAGNIVAFNGGAGVAVGSSASDSTTVGNSIRGNSIYSNTGLGIDLGNDGVTLNTPGGPHVGPNNFQNFPVLVSVRPGATSTEITGSLNSLVSATFALDFYANSTADPSGYGQGQQYLGSGTVTTDVNGLGNFDITLNTAVPLGVFISATATDPSGNTSEFAKDIQPNTPPTAGIANAPATGLVGIPIPLVANVTDPNPQRTFSFAWSVSLNASPYTLPPDVSTTEQTFIFTPQQTGSYQVSLVVTDNLGAVSPTATATIAVGSAVSPAVQITAPISSPTGQFLTLTSTVSEPTSGVSISNYAWSVTKDGSPYTLPPGTVTTAPSFTFAPTPAGNYVVSLTATDSLSRSGSASADILVFDSTPAALILVAPGPTAVEGTPITLTNQVTSPALTGPLTYNWIITKNGNPFTSETDTIGTFTFVPTEEGTYGVSLTVSNGTQIGTAVPITLTITNATPVVTISNVPQSDQSGTAITLQGSASDADPKVPGSGSTDPYVLTWTAFATSGQAIPLGSGPTFSFVPMGAGVIDVTLTATDEAGLATSTTAAIPITQVIRTVTITPPSSPQEGTPFSWTAAVSPPGSGITFTYNWTVTDPNGNTHTFTTGPTGSTSTLTYSTPPIVPGTYQVSVTVSGSDGSTGTAVPPNPGTTITVANAVPSVTINVPPPPNGHSGFQEGDSITLTSVVSDLGVDLTNPIYSWTVTGPDSFSASGVQSSINFIPTESGAYTATLNVTDANKGVGTATQTINVAHLSPTPMLKFGTGISNNMISVTAVIPDPGAEDLFSYTISVNGQQFLPLPQTGPSLTFDIPYNGTPEVVTVAVTDTDSGSASTNTTVVVVPANTTKNLTASDVGSSSEILAIAQSLTRLRLRPTRCKEECPRLRRRRVCWSASPFNRCAVGGSWRNYDKRSFS